MYQYKNDIYDTKFQDSTQKMAILKQKSSI